MKAKIFEVRVDLYPVLVVFYFGNRPKTIKKYRPEIDVTHLYTGCSTTFYKEEQTVVCICKELPITPEAKGFLSHEIFHVSEYILKFVGIKHSESSSEAFSYLIQHITECVYTKLNIK